MRLLLVLGTIAFTLFSTSASSGVITTTFAHNNQQSGNMFDVVNSIGDLTITGFDLNLASGNWDIEVYKKSGTWVGFNNNAGAWDFVGGGNVTSSGAGLASFFDITDFLLNGSSTTALYITGKIANLGILQYTNGTGVGNVFSDNGELQILEGAGISYAFSGTFQPRVWNGSIYYEAAVPAPATLALIGIGLIGIVLSRRKKTA